MHNVEFYKEYDFIDYSEIYYPIQFEDVKISEIPLNSEFDDSAEDSDFRLVKIKFFDEWNNNVKEISYDIQCYCQHIGTGEPQWESIIKYPRFVSGSKERNAYHQIQRKIKNLKPETSKTFSVRINLRETQEETNEKIQKLIRKVEGYKNLQ